MKSRRCFEVPLLLAALLAGATARGQAVTGTSLSITGGGTSSLSGPLNVTGASNLSSTLNVVGTIDSDSNTLSFGTESSSYGMALLYASSATDTVKFSINRASASWLWVHNTNAAAMRLDSAHQLLLYRSDGTTAGLTFTPQTGVLKLGTHASGTLTGNDSTGLITAAGPLTVAGAFTASSGIANTTGAFTSPTALSLSAGGTNQNITLSPSGTGYTLVNGSARFTGGGTFGYTGNVGANNGLILGTVAKATAPSGGQGSIQVNSNDATNPLQGWVSLISDPTAANRRLAIGAVEQNVGWRNVTLAEAGGNVGIGTTSPQARLQLGSYFDGTGEATNHGDLLFSKQNTSLAATGGIEWKIASDNYGAKIDTISSGGANLVFGLRNNSATWTEALRINPSGNVGIGTTNPADKLEVGNGTVATGFAVYGNATGSKQSWVKAFDKSGVLLGLAIGHGNVDRIILNGGGNTFFNGGNVGIGTSSPAQLLHLKGGNAWTVLERGSTANVAVTTFANVGNVPAWAVGLVDASNTLGVFNYGTNSNALSIVPSGNVGIGTSSPSRLLEVSANTSVFPKVTSTNSYDAAMQFSSAGTDVYVGRMPTSGGGAGTLDFYNGGLRMAITPAGNVGIGNNAPAHTLDVNGSIHMTSGNFLHNSVHGNYEVQQLLAANNGAGTGDAGLYSWVSEPGATWTGAGIARNMINSTGAFPRVNTGLTGQMMRFDEGTGIWFTTETAAGTRYTPLVLSGNDTIANGKVGIGTSAPGTKLHVQDVNPEMAMGLTADPVSYNRFGFTGGTNPYISYWAQNATWNGTQWNHVYGPGYSGAAVKLQQYYGSFQIDTAPTGSTDPIAWNTRFFVANNGNIGIGTVNPSHLLAVNGTIRAKEIIVDNTNWADYVFADSYRLAPLTEVEQHIKANKHLPGIPSAAEIAEKGVSMGDMQAKLLSKIEEITLHQIAQEKAISALQAENATLRQQVSELKAAAAP